MSTDEKLRGRGSAAFYSNLAWPLFARCESELCKALCIGNERTEISLTSLPAICSLQRTGR